MTLRGGESEAISDSESENPSPDVDSCSQGGFGRVKEEVNISEQRADRVQDGSDNS